MSKILILTGPGGAGKSTIARMIAKHCGHVYLDGDHEDTEFFPNGNQWLAVNTELLQKAHRKILNKAKQLAYQGEDVVIDYIIFGRYLAFLDMFRDYFGENVQIRVLLPSQEELIRRDKEREIWTTGAERIVTVSRELLSIKQDIGEENFIDTTDQTPEETFERFFGSCKRPSKQS